MSDYQKIKGICNDPKYNFNNLNTRDTSYYKAQCERVYKKEKAQAGNPWINKGVITASNNFTTKLKDDGQEYRWWDEIDSVDMQDIFSTGIPSIPWGLVGSKAYDLLYGLMYSLTTREGREDMALMIGVNHIPAMIAKVLPIAIDTISNKIDMWKTSAEFKVSPSDIVAVSREGIEESISAGIADTSILLTEEEATDGLLYLAVNTAKRFIVDVAFGAGRGISFAMKTGMNVISGVFKFLLDAIFYIQLVGMFLDIWDPSGCLDDQNTVGSFNAEVLENFVENMNDSYSNSFGLSLTDSSIVVTDSGEQIYESVKWPIEFDASSIMYNRVTTPHNDTLASIGLSNNKGDPMSWEDIRTYYFDLYLNSLTYNSSGFKIERHCMSEDQADQTWDLKKKEDVIMLDLMNQNTKAANFMEKYWPLFILIFLILVFIIIKLLL